jgi:copper transport protein
LVLAAANKWRHTAALGRGEATARVRLDRNIRLEAGALMAAVALVAAMGQSVPPRALHDHSQLALDHTHDHAHDAHRHEHHESISVQVVDRLGRRASLQVSPGRPGLNVIEVEFHSADGLPLTPLEARVRFAQPDRGIEPLTRQMEVGEGVARYEGSDMSLPGRWIVRIEALVTDFDRAIFETEVVFHQ